PPSPARRRDHPRYRPPDLPGCLDLRVPIPRPADRGSCGHEPRQGGAPGRGRPDRAPGFPDGRGNLCERRPPRRGTGRLLPPPGPGAPARAQAFAALSSLASELDTAWSVVHGLPDFLGANGPRTYFFGAADPAELRGSLGLIGAYSILTVDDGAFRFSPFRP